MSTYIKCMYCEEDSKDIDTGYCSQCELFDCDDRDLIKLNELVSTENHPQFYLSKDGDHWCATLPDFINLQESHTGFGKSPVSAILSLLKTP